MQKLNNFKGQIAQKLPPWGCQLSSNNSSSVTALRTKSIRDAVSTSRTGLYIRTRSSIDDPKQLRRYDPVTVIYVVVKLKTARNSVNSKKLLSNLLYMYSLTYQKWHTTKCRLGRSVGRIWTVTICGSLQPTCGSVITAGSGLELRSGLGLGWVANCCIQTAEEGDKMWINHLIKTDQWRCAPQICPDPHFVVSHQKQHPANFTQNRKLSSNRILQADTVCEACNCERLHQHYAVTFLHS